MGGKWEDREPLTDILIRECVEVRMVPKYTPIDRWYIEVWMPPETYGTPEQWSRCFTEYIDGRSVETLGAYPSRGEYEMCYVCQDDNGKFVQITPRLASTVAKLVLASRNLTSEERLQGLKDKKAQEDKKWEDKADMILSDNEPFHGMANSTNPRPVMELKKEKECQATRN